MPKESSEELLYAAQQNCSCYKKGHNLHWIAVLKKWPDEPRIPVSIVAAPNDAFLVTTDAGIQVLYCHSPARVAWLIEQNGSHGWSLVGDTGAMTTAKRADGSMTWSFFSDQPVGNCEKSKCECYDPDDIWDED